MAGIGSTFKFTQTCDIFSKDDGFEQEIDNTTSPALFASVLCYTVESDTETKVYTDNNLSIDTSLTFRLFVHSKGHYVSRHISEINHPQNGVLGYVFSCDR